MSQVYIAGPMTGKPAYNWAAFSRAAEDWRREGWRVVTPHECNSAVWERHHGRPFDPFCDKCDWGEPLLKEMFAEDVKALCASDAAAFLPGWEQSKGASLEYKLATQLGLELYNADLFTPLAEPQESVCGEADRIVSGDRGAAYGHPFDDYTRTGAIWGALLWDWAKYAASAPIPIPVPPHLAVLCMIGVKQSREVHAPKRDNRVDICGYAKCLDMVRERQAI